MPALGCWITPASGGDEDVAAVLAPDGAGAAEAVAVLEILERGGIRRRVGDETLAGGVQATVDDAVLGACLAVHDGVGLGGRRAVHLGNIGDLRHGVERGLEAAGLIAPPFSFRRRCREDNEGV